MEETLTLTQKRKPVRTVEDLSPEVIQEILSRLPIDSLCQSRCVRQSWRNLVKEARFSKMHLAQASRNQNPGLIMGTLDSELYTIKEDCETSDEAIKLCKLPFLSWLPIFKLVGSCNGFVCLADDSYCYRSIFICNPVTGEYMKLPDDANFGKVNGAFFGFDFDPEKEKYKVVRLRFITNDRTFEVEIHTVGTDSWRSIGNLKKLLSMKRECAGVLAGGNLHWLSFDNSYKLDCIVAVDARDEKIQFIEPPPISALGKDHTRIHMGSLGGYLSLADDSFRNHVNVWIMKDYGMTESWTKEFVIKRPSMPNSLGMAMQTLGLQKDGKILVLCSAGVLLLYDPRSKSFKDLRIHRLPNLFQALPHMPSLLSFKDAFVSEASMRQ